MSWPKLPLGSYCHQRTSTLKALFQSYLSPDDQRSPRTQLLICTFFAIAAKHRHIQYTRNESGCQLLVTNKGRTTMTLRL